MTVHLLPYVKASIPDDPQSGRLHLNDELSKLERSITSSTAKLNQMAPLTPPTVTGSRGGNAALASLLTTLAAAGIIVDAST